MPEFLDNALEWLQRRRYSEVGANRHTKAPIYVGKTGDPGISDDVAGATFFNKKLPGNEFIVINKNTTPIGANLTDDQFNNLRGILAHEGMHVNQNRDPTSVPRTNRAMANPHYKALSQAISGSSTVVPFGDPSALDSETAAYASTGTVLPPWQVLWAMSLQKLLNSTGGKQYTPSEVIDMDMQKSSQDAVWPHLSDLERRIAQSTRLK